MADTSQADLEQLRKWFARAEQIAHRPKSSEYKYLQKQLKDYPLYPYVELKTLKHYPYLSNREKIIAFLDQYAGTPLDKPLRKKWLEYLAKKGEGELFLASYADIGSASLACEQIKFKLADPAQTQAALKQVEQLWLVGKSQPKACDPAFKVWQQSGGRTPDIVWQRLSLAADGGNHTLIPYLKTLLPEDQRYLADLWLKVRRSPSYVSKLSKFPGTHPEKEGDIIAYGLGRLIWRDKNLALKTWQSVQQRYALNAEQQQHIASKFAIGLVTSNHSQSDMWLEKAGSLVVDRELSRWHLAHTVRQQDWQHAIELIDSLPQATQQKLEFRYWQARGLEQLDAGQQAEEHFASLAQHRHYYGFLASGKLKQPPNMVNVPLTFTEQQIAAIKNLPAARRAYEFYQLERYASARREWRYLRSVLDREQQMIAAVIADQWGWHDQAIFTFADAGYMDDIERRFPTAYREQLIAKSNEHDIEPEWAFAIVRRESSFMADANSGAGAKGLMQVLPSTARYLSKRKVSNKTLFDPEKNLDYGTQYMRYLMDKMDNNPVLVTASYNAGWRRVRDWIPETEQMPADIWVENIPYRETREYVKAVMAYKQIYAQLLGKSSTLFNDLSTMQISRATASF